MPLSPINNTVTVDWGGTPAPLQPRAASVNLYQAYNPTVAQNPTYQAAIDYLNPEAVRIHNSEMMLESTGPNARAHGWVINPDVATYAWDVPKVTAALAAMAPGRLKMLTICKFPRALTDTSGRLLAGKATEFGNFCVQLIDIAVQHGVTHIGLLNELDGLYTGATNMGALGAIWNAVRDIIKAAHPTIQIGGMAFANVYNNTNLNTYLAVCGAKMDFCCFNAYSRQIGAVKTQQELWDSAINNAKAAIDHVKNRLTANGFPSVPVWMTESGQMLLNGFDPNNVNSKEMIWSALRLANTATSIAQFMARWNDADDWFGAYSSPLSGYTKRPSAEVFHWWNALFKTGNAYPHTKAGDRVPVDVNDSAKGTVFGVQAIAITRPNNKRAMMLINRSELTRNVSIVNTGWSLPAQTKLDLKLITETGVTQIADIVYGQLEAGYVMPVDTILIVSEK